MNKKFILFLPLILLLSVCLLLFVGLHKDPKQIASALINKPVPEFYQANLLEPSQIVIRQPCVQFLDLLVLYSKLLAFPV